MLFAVSTNNEENPVEKQNEDHSVLSPMGEERNAQL